MGSSGANPTNRNVTSSVKHETLSRYNRHTRGALDAVSLLGDSDFAAIFRSANHPYLLENRISNTNHFFWRNLYELVVCLPQK